MISKLKQENMQETLTNEMQGCRSMCGCMNSKQ